MGLEGGRAGLAATSLAGMGTSGILSGPRGRELHLLDCSPSVWAIALLSLPGGMFSARHLLPCMDLLYLWSVGSPGAFQI